MKKQCRTLTIHQDSSGESGFTLIELSIVLVIIGLIVGGILVGQDMIKAAEIRATITQIQKYDSAVNTFRSKYGYIPGDIPSTVASNFGVFNITGANANLAGYGDGNGMVENCGAGAWTSVCGEPLIFWRHLSDTALVDGNFGSTGNGLLVNTNGQLTGPLSAGLVNEVLPPAKLGRGNYIAVYSASGTNWFEVTGFTGTAIPATGTPIALAKAMTPLEADTMDVKIDDGLPLSGSVQASDSATTLGAAPTPGAANCVSAAPSIYNANTTIGNNTLCELLVRFN